MISNCVRNKRVHSAVGSVFISHYKRTNEQCKNSKLTPQTLSPHRFYKNSGSTPPSKALPISQKFMRRVWGISFVSTMCSNLIKYWIDPTLNRTFFENCHVSVIGSILVNIILLFIHVVHKVHNTTI